MTSWREDRSPGDRRRGIRRVSHSPANPTTSSHLQSSRTSIAIAQFVAQRRRPVDRHLGPPPRVFRCSTPRKHMFVFFFLFFSLPLLSSQADNHLSKQSKAVIPGSHDDILQQQTSKQLSIKGTLHFLYRLSRKLCILIRCAI
jgi:hypothetical protein